MNKCRGITLIELLIVVIMVGILAAIAVPVYTGYLQRARRADAKVALEQLRAAQEMRRAEIGGYSTDMAALQTTWGVPANPVGDYTLRWAAGFTLNANSFTAEAWPNVARQLSDGSLFIDNRGRKWDEDGNVFPEGKWAK